MNLASATTTAAMLITTPFQAALAAPAGHVTHYPVAFRWQSEERITSSGHAWADAQIQQLAALPANWDGYGAERVSRARLTTMAALLRAYLPDRVSPGTIVPAADGSLQAEWHLISGSFGLLIEEDGSLAAWYQSNDGRPELAHTGPAAVSLFESAALLSFA